jgi:hypothetical protein
MCSEGAWRGRMMVLKFVLVLSIKIETSGTCIGILSDIKITSGGCTKYTSENEWKKQGRFDVTNDLYTDKLRSEIRLIDHGFHSVGDDKIDEEKESPKYAGDDW